MGVQIIKPGIKTTEFWVTVVTVLAAAATGMEGIVDPKIASILAAFSTIAYTISRGFAKK